MNPTDILRRAFRMGRSRPTPPIRRKRKPTEHFAMESLEDRTVFANDLFIVPGALNESVDLSFIWHSRHAAFNNEIGIYQVDDSSGSVNGLSPGDAGYAQAASARAQQIFSSGQGAGARTNVTLSGGGLFGLYLVQNASLGTQQIVNPSNAVNAGPVTFFSFDSANPDGVDHVLGNISNSNQQYFAFEDLTGGGDRDFNDAVIRIERSVNRVLTVAGTANQTQTASFRLASRDSSFRSEVGIVTVDDSTGRINNLNPGDVGYAAAALARRQVIFSPSAEEGAQTSLNLQGQQQFLYYLIDNGTADAFLATNPSNTFGGLQAYFSLAAANPDGVEHVRSVGENLLAFEDLFGLGDADFNDLVIEANVPLGAPSSIDFTVELDNDTSGSGGTSSDGVTNDASLLLTFDPNDPPQSVLVGINGQPINTFVEVVGSLNADGTLIVDSSQLASAAGGTLPQGTNTVRIVAQGGTGGTGEMLFSFTFDGMTAAPLTLLNRESDAGTVGDFITNTQSVNLTGTAEALSLVEIVGRGLQTTANAAGEFSFNNVTLTNGSNSLIVRATDRAGNTAEQTRTITVANAGPTLVNPIADQTLDRTTTSRVIPFELATVFNDADINNSLVRFLTNFGNVDIELFDRGAPATVANFFEYIEGGDYVDTIFHRLDSNFVLQGGGFRLTGTPPNTTLPDVPADPAIPNEFDSSRSNVAGTVAMAKLGSNPNSATNEFFFNLNNNSQNLDNQNGGFTVFGEIASTSDLDLAALANFSIRNFGSPFNELPVVNFPTGTLNNLARNNLAVINATQILRRVEELTFTVTVDQTSNPNLLTTSGNNRLFVTVNPNQSGFATLTVTATDRAGASVSDTFTITVGDPVVVTAALVNDTGTAGDGITSNPAISGSIQADNTVTSVQMRLTGQGVDSGLVNITNQVTNNQFTLTAPFLNAFGPGSALVDGSYTIQIIAQDSLGTQGMTTVAFTLDTMISTPNPELAAASDSGTVGDLLTNQSTVVLVGEAEAGSTVQVLGQSVQTTADSNGDYTLTGVMLTQGTNVLTVRSTDAAGNIADITITITLDTSNAAPIVGLAPASDSGTQGDLITNLASVTLAGIADPNTSISVVGQSATATTTGGGVFTLTGVMLTEGANPLTIRSTDAAGNVAQTGITIMLDSTTAAPTAELEAASDSGALGDLLTNIASVNLAGVVEAGNLVEVVGQAVQATADGSGNYVLTGVALSEGANTLTIRTTDVAGNTAETMITVTLDSSTSQPTADLDPATDGGNNGDQLTNLANVTLVGTAEAGATVQVVGQSPQATADSNGDYSLAGIMLAEGANTLTIRATDAAGNTAESMITITLDTMIGQPTVDLAPASDSGTLGDLVTNISSVTLIGTADPSTVVRVLGTASLTTADSNGDYTLTGVMLTEGENVLTIRSTDAAGNTSDVMITITLDTTSMLQNAGLDVGSDSGALGDLITNQEIVTFVGIVEPFAKVEIESLSLETTADENGFYRFAGIMLNQGVNSFLVESTDVAGNSADQTYEVTRANAAPTVVELIGDLTGTRQSVAQMASIEVAAIFGDADMSNSLVRFSTNRGDLDIELFDSSAPATVANFFNYIEDGDYVNSIFHRLDPGFVLQGGGFTLNGTPPSTTLPQIPRDPIVPNEPSPSRSNIGGTVAMARSGAVNSASSQFFFNLANNSQILDNQNGGFTVFGAIALESIPVLADLTTFDTEALGGAFNELPVENFNGSAIGDLTASNLIVVQSTTVLRRLEQLTYTVTVDSTTNPNLVSTSVDNRLFVTVNPNQSGTTTLTVTATDRAGASVSDTFTVTIT